MTPDEREQQWLRILSLPRQQRRAAARQLAWEAMSVPSGEPHDGNRAERRAGVKAARQYISPKLVKVSKRRQRLANRALRDARRYARLGERRKTALRDAEVARALLEEVHEDALD